MASDAIGIERVSRVVGYKLKKGDFRLTSPNLPQRIAILGEANEDFQGVLDLSAKEITSSKQAGELYGYGSPIHLMMRILRPSNGDGVGGIPTIVYPQAKAGGAAAKVFTVTPSGTATANGTHFLVIAGRTSIDGKSYALNIESGDTVADINQKIEDTVNAALSCPVTCVSTDYVSTFTSKWNGLTANGITVSVDTGDDDLGLSYNVVSTQVGSGTPSIDDALELFGNEWNTIVINGYGLVSSVMDSLEDFNGIADDENPTGRYVGTVWKPFIAISGSVSDDPSSITDSREGEMTIAVAPAPNSAGLAFEAAANMAYLAARQMQNSPHLDVMIQSYPDMPTPTDIGTMSDYNERDAIVKKGCSTVDLVAEKYTVQDFVTTYHPDGEEPPQFRWCRNLNIDWNIRYGYYLLEQINVVGHVLANDGDVVTAEKVCTPKQWKQQLFKYSDDLTSRALTADPAFMQASITSEIGSSNPDRFETFYRYKRTGIGRVLATTGEAGFNYGTVN